MNSETYFKKSTELEDYRELTACFSYQVTPLIHYSNMRKLVWAIIILTLSYLAYSTISGFSVSDLIIICGLILFSMILLLLRHRKKL